LNGIGVAFTILASLLMVTLPRRWAAVPLLLGAAWMTRGQAVEIGPATFTTLRIVVAVGFLRVLLRRESLANGLNAVDRWLLAWAAVLITTSAFHGPGAWLYRSGIVWTEVGCYFLFRIFLRDSDDVIRVFKATCAVLLPVAAAMVVEKITLYNVFSVFGEVHETATVRHGNVRGSGPFAHPILAGTVGAGCFAMALVLWRRHRTQALLGLFAALGIVTAATSSSPILMICIIVFVLLLWPIRERLGSLRWLAIFLILALAAVMQDPVYFLMARIDLSGGSQGYFRAQLIRSSLEHLDEWWLFGTDRTRHWMSSGVRDQAHTDITNHFLAMGVMGGLLLLFAFIMVVLAAFRALGRTLRSSGSAPDGHAFLAWALGALLFGHAMNFLSISLFDQSVVFFHLILAAVGAVAVPSPMTRSVLATPVPGYRLLVWGSAPASTPAPWRR
jgi:hypothetical protein